MKIKDICRHIDYTLLKATATYNDIYQLCAEAIKNECASVCIPSSFVGEMNENFPTLNICTVVGFPLGNSSTLTKMREANVAVANGANEIDMVINISKAKEKDYDYIEAEIECIRTAIGDKVLKVIIETCYLTDEEIEIISKIVDRSSADYVKTSTGFGTRGASFKDIEIIKKAISSNTLIKASGGIRTKEDMERYVNMGCDRIGASALPK